MADKAVITFRVEQELKDQFSERARANDRTDSQVLRDFMRSFVEAPTYDEWFRSQVAAALDDDRPAIPSEAVEQHFAAKRKAARRAASSRRKS